MLVLSRRINEAVVLQLPSGETIRVILRDVDRNKVRLGIEAPPEVQILRTELLALDDPRRGNHPDAASRREP